MRKKNWILTACLVAALPSGAGAETAVGAAYARNIFAGAFVGGLMGATTGLIPYAAERGGHDPAPIAYAATYGAVGTAVILAPLLSAYEIGSQKRGAGTSVLFSTMGFSLVGAAAGAGYSMISYQERVYRLTRQELVDAGIPPSVADDVAAKYPGRDDAEIILRDAAYGALGGAALGFLTGLWEIFIWRQSDGLVRPPGSGIHADLKFLQPGTTLKGPLQTRVLPHMKLAEWHF